MEKHPVEQEKDFQGSSHLFHTSLNRESQIQGSIRGFKPLIIEEVKWLRERERKDWGGLGILWGCRKRSGRWGGWTGSRLVGKDEAVQEQGGWTVLKSRWQALDLGTGKVAINPDLKSKPPLVRLISKQERELFEQHCCKGSLLY